MKTYSKLWLGLLSSGLLASFCASSIAGDFPSNSTSVNQTVAPSVAKGQSKAKKQGAPMEYTDADTLQSESPAAMPMPHDSSSNFTVVPGATLMAPMGFGAEAGQAFAGISGISRDPSSDTADGSLAWGFGLGDANRYVGATVSFALDTLHPDNTSIGSAGSVNFAVSRNLPMDSAISIGANRLVSWGGAAMSKAPSFYASFSKMFTLCPDNAANPMPLTLTLGGGNGYFRKLHDQNMRKHNIGYFGAAALEFHPQASLIVDYTGSILTSGVSVVPDPTLPLTVSLGMYDLNKQYSSRISAIASVGYAFTY